MGMKRRLVREIVGGESYDYYPLGEHVVSCPEVCRGRPTFKYTRIEVASALDLVAAGRSTPDIVKSFAGRVPAPAIEEAVKLAAKALVQNAPRKARKA
jgi:uncharacterized protein (DUF433 family)